jgi:hypothetical protein
VFPYQHLKNNKLAGRFGNLWVAAKIIAGT